MKKLSFILLLVVLKLNANATTVFASGFGWDSGDATDAFQSAINSEADTIIVDKQESDWIVGTSTFQGIQDKTIIFQKGISSMLETIRMADTVNFPVGVTYAIDGTALQGEDYIRMNGFMILPTNLFSHKDTICVLQDDNPEDMGQLFISQEGQGKVNRISLNGLVKGMYIIKIQLYERLYQ